MALRQAQSWDGFQDEEGIWHDDGSRKMGFSLSLNLAPQRIEGGELLIRHRLLHPVQNDEGSLAIGPLSFGELVLFKTGLEGVEHRTRAVNKGNRLVLAGWCW